MPLTPTDRDEHFFKAMVDAADGSTPEELQPTERREHWYKEIIDAVGLAGGSGGSGVLVVHLERVGNDGVLDKTWAEIDAADVAVIVFSVSRDGGTYHYRELVTETAFSNGSYLVSTTTEVSGVSYVATNADGYPVRQRN